MSKKIIIVILLLGISYMLSIQVTICLRAVIFEKLLYKFQDYLYIYTSMPLTNCACIKNINLKYLISLNKQFYGKSLIIYRLF